ncbi:MAG: hypothetical protein U0800_02415 [Isosphaeraceae bacterium]
MRPILATCLIVLASGSHVRAQEPVPDDSPLDAARLAWQAAEEAAGKKLLDALRARQEAAGKAGDLRAHDAILAEVEAFERDNRKLPSAAPAALQDYQKALARARTAMVVVFEKTIRDLTRQGKLDEARSAQAEIDYRRRTWEGRKDKAAGIPEAAAWIDPIGRPSEFRAGQLPRYAIWVDDQGWHLRVTDKGSGRRPFSGKILVAGGQVAAIRPVADVGVEDDTVRCNADRDAIEFLLHPNGIEDGFDFAISGAEAVLQFELLFNKTPDGIRIGVGRKSANPGESIFRLQVPKPVPR